ncbi:hypothetical protein GCM10010977_05700 [Citricoccus zhacaiensis]|uniref:Uncharacterized protein n=1 Tax=Citricoccus zhacaiensis TaxID=489142 RepID=A0ABQ2LPR0_9MICC|nr:hypothetical protein [Citricoccus zhacaiensis]GGO41538.1 hypothetical protein GCM10010977_05700 [Citricoccus zhacaiensis]
MTDNPQQPQGNPASQQPGQQPPAAPGPLPYGTPAQQPYAAPDQQGSKYGTGAYNPGEVGQPMGEPKSWGRLKMLTLLSLAIYVVSSIVSFLTAGNEAILEEQLDAQAGMGIPRDELEDIVEMSMGFVMVTAVVALVIAVVVYLLVYFGLRKGKNWARILGTVFAALGTLFTLYGLTGIGTMMSAAPGLGIVTLVITVVFLLVNIWWLVTAFSKDSNAYVNSRR